MGIFSQYKVSDAKVSGGGVYIREGEFEFEIEETKAVPTRDKGPMFVADLLIVSSTNPSQPAGARVNYPVLLAKDWGPGNVKGFLCSAAGLDATAAGDAPAVAKENWDDMLEVAVTQPVFRGKKVRCVATKVYNKVAKLLINKNPELLNDEKFTSDPSNSYVRVTFKPHEETRAALQAPAKKAK